ncbi:hypothetical protein TCAL_15675, partial [Tigriopus californicus]
TYAINSAAKRECLSKKNYREYRTNDFHIGPDGKLHSTDSHDARLQLQEYCIDQYGKSVAPANPGPSSEQELQRHFRDDRNFHSNVSILHKEELKNFYNELRKQKPTLKEEVPWSMDIMYCASTILQIRKCCPNNTILNLRN